MVTATELASALGLKTAAELRAPRARAADGTWKPGPSERARIREAGFTAVYIAASDKIVPRYLGDNEGGWPVLTGVTGSWEDTISKQMDRLSPFYTLRVRFRYWTLSEDWARELHEFIDGYLRDRCDELRGAWLDLGPDTDLHLMAEEIGDALDRRRPTIFTFDDAEFIRRIRKMVAEHEARS